MKRELDWTRLLDKPRLYTDLNNWEEVDGSYRVILEARGTFDDLERYGITLTEGLALDFWMDDGDMSGQPDPLLFSGSVHFDQKFGRWVAVVDRNSIINASRRK